MLMLLCVHVTRVLFLVLAGNSALTMGFYSSRPFLCALGTIYAFRQHMHPLLDFGAFGLVGGAIYTCT